MIDERGWFSFAERMPGPVAKVWFDINSRQGVVFHSAVGSLQGVINVVMGPASNERSVTGVVAYDGRLIQFYPVTASPWANGSHEANKRFLGFEHEGGIPDKIEINDGVIFAREHALLKNEQALLKAVNEPLTEEQIATDVRILQDLAAFDGNNPATYWERPLSASDKQATEYEHNQMTRFGASPTACPSGRINWDEINRRLNMPEPDFLKDEARKWRGRYLLDWAVTNDYQVYPSPDKYAIDFWRNGEVQVSLPIASVPEWWSTLPEIPA